MHFEYPYVLYLLILPIIAFVVNRNKTDYKKYFAKEMFNRVFVNYKSQTIRFFLLTACYALVVVAVAGPAIYNKTNSAANKDINIVTAIDMSKSMTTKDVYPNRFAFAKQKLLDFIKQEHGLNIAVVGYSDFPFLISAGTNDKNTLAYLVSHTKLKQMNPQGTNLFALLKGAKQLLQNDKNRVVVIFTDGGQSSVLSKDIKYAKEHHLHIFIYGVATLKGGVIKSGGKILTNVHHQVVITRLNTNIQQLCKATKGAFFAMSTSSKGIDKLIRIIKNRYLPKSKVAQISNVQELYYIPLMAAIVLFLLLFTGQRR